MSAIGDVRELERSQLLGGFMRLRNAEVVNEDEKIPLQHAHDVQADGHARGLDQVAGGNQRRGRLSEHRRYERPHDESGREGVRARDHWSKIPTRRTPCLTMELQ